MTGTPQDITTETANLIPLPPYSGLSDRQVRGCDCVWCGIVLTTHTAADLGERRMRRLDTHISWFPRGCRQCTGQAAYNALFDHSPMCKQCVDNAAGCDTGRELRRLVKEGFRR